VIGLQGEFLTLLPVTGSSVGWSYLQKNISLYPYTRLDKIRSEVIRKDLEISGIQDVRLKYIQN